MPDARHPRVATGRRAARRLLIWGCSRDRCCSSRKADFVWGLIASMYLGNIAGSSSC
jgi:hypothetical protein